MILEKHRHSDEFSKDFKSFFWKEQPNTKLFNEHPTLKKILVGLNHQELTKNSVLDQLWSSYRQYGYQVFFSELVRYFKPKSIVEIGVLQGFSLLNMGLALKENKFGVIHGYDLFEDYQFRNEKKDVVQRHIDQLGLQETVKIFKEDAFKVVDKYSTVDILHVDISNNGDVVKTFFETWNEKVKTAIIFEGGSKDRDQVEWMIKFNKKPINPVLKEIQNNYNNWEIFIFDQFPSLTLCLRKNDK